MLDIIIVIGMCYIVLFLFAYKIKDNSIVDVFWGLGFLIITLLLLLKSDIGLAQMISFVLILFWSLRIVVSIGSKKLKKLGEDRRYAKWRKQWKHFYLRSFFQVYMLQMILMFGVASTLFVIFSGTGSNIYITMFGTIVSMLGLIYETIADNQLKAFLNSKNKAKNTIFTEGLWKYSRHPNYLGEVIFWSGLTLISLQYSFWGVFGGVLIAVLLLFVSGVPLKEKSYQTKSNWKSYKLTPLFIPNFFK